MTTPEPEDVPAAAFTPWPVPPDIYDHAADLARAANRVHAVVYQLHEAASEEDYADMIDTLRAYLDTIEQGAQGLRTLLSPTMCNPSPPVVE